MISAVRVYDRASRRYYRRAPRWAWTRRESARIILLLEPSNRIAGILEIEVDKLQVDPLYRVSREEQMEKV